MAESTELHDQTIPRAGQHAGGRVLERAWEKIKIGIARTILWSYDRGTWQYDIIVLAILAFIFLTPRSWFQDRPTLQLTDLRHRQGFVEVSRNKDERRYMVDARLVESLAPAKPEDAVREILRRRLQGSFTVKSIDVLRDKNNVILGYTVAVVPP